MSASLPRARVSLCLSLGLLASLGCTAKAPTPPPPDLPQPAPALDGDELAALEAERDRLFAALLAREQDAETSTRVRTLKLAEAVAHTRSHDAAHALAQLITRERHRIHGKLYDVSADGRRAVTYTLEGTYADSMYDAEGCMGARPGTVVLHDTVTAERIGAAWKVAAMSSLALDPSGARVAISDGGHVRVVNSTDGALLFEVEHSPCLDDPMEPNFELEIVWHPDGAAFAAHRRYGGELVVWSREGKLLLREPLDHASPLSAASARAALWTRLGLQPEPPAPDRAVQLEMHHHGVYEVLDGPEGAVQGVFALDAWPRAAHLIAGHPELALAELPDGLAVLDWTDAGMFAAVCDAVDGGLSSAEWTDHLPAWPWRSRCDSEISNTTRLDEPRPALDDEIAGYWRQLFEHALAKLEQEPLRAEPTMLVRLYALLHLDSPELRNELAQQISTRPRVTALPAAGPVSSLLPAPQSGRVALLLEDGRVEVRDAHTGEGGVVDTLDPNDAVNLQWAGGQLVHLSWRAEPSGAGVVTLRTVGADPSTQRFEPHPTKARAPTLGLSSDGARLLVVDGARKGKLELWDVEAGVRIHEARSRAKRRCVCCCGEPCACPEIVSPMIYFSPDSRYAAIDLFQEIPVIELATGKQVTTIAPGNPDGINDLQFDLAGERVFVYHAWRFGGSDVLIHSLVPGVEAQQLIYGRRWPPEGAYTGVEVVEGEDPDPQASGALVVGIQLLLTSVRVEQEALRNTDPSLKAGELVRVGEDRVAEIGDDMILRELPRLPAGQEPVISGDRRALLSLDPEQGRALRWEPSDRDPHALVESEGLDALREAVCSSVSRDLSRSEWLRHVGDVPFTPLCGEVS